MRLLATLIVIKAMQRHLIPCNLRTHKLHLHAWWLRFMIHVLVDANATINSTMIFKFPQKSVFELFLVVFASTKSQPRVRIALF